MACAAPPASRVAANAMPESVSHPRPPKGCCALTGRLGPPPASKKLYSLRSRRRVVGCPLQSDGRSNPHMAKRSSMFPDSFEVDVISLLRGQVDAIVHELAVAISDIQSGFRAEEAEDYLYEELENLVPAMREQSARLREQHQRELKRHVRNEQELAKLRAEKRERQRQMKEQHP